MKFPCLVLDKDIKVRSLMVWEHCEKPGIYWDEDILYVEENHDGKYGAPGKKRQPKRKLTPEDIYRINHWNKIKKARLLAMEYFSPGDIWATYTYKPENLLRYTNSSRSISEMQWEN
ncbi:MAG: hypothetical protein ACLUTU_03690 [Blautia faecis]